MPFWRPHLPSLPAFSSSSTRTISPTSVGQSTRTITVKHTSSMHPNSIATSQSAQSFSVFAAAIIAMRVIVASSAGIADRRQAYDLKIGGSGTSDDPVVITT